ncbi:hypothetical protein [Leifsonia sp. EB34]|uniref:hypothetical protein n=1 Tax=Leifsonia sp. EB34 TaxID=3156303 RepID=UPI003512D922
MSTYRTATTSYTSTSVSTAFDSASTEYEALLHGLCSQAAATLAADLADMPLATPSAVAAAWSHVDQALPLWREHLPVSSLDALTEAQTGSVPLQDAVAAVAQDLGALERFAAADTAAAVLPMLGYAIERADGECTSAFEARNGHETMLIMFRDGGAVEMDYLGLIDGSCNDRQAEFVDAMREAGIALDEQANVQHHDPRGGSLAQNAARGGGSLAERLVSFGDQSAARLVPQPAMQAVPTGRRRARKYAR